MKSIVTEYPEICSICGRPAEAEHHLIFGTAGRELSEKDGLKIPICNDCHNMGRLDMRIHGNPIAEKLSKMLGQAVWEQEVILSTLVSMASGSSLELGELNYADNSIRKYEDEKRRFIKARVREMFRKRYGKSYF